MLLNDLPAPIPAKTAAIAPRRIAGRFNAWLFRDRGPESTPIVLTQRRVFVLPTRPGLVFGAVLAAMLIGAINYQLSLGFALTFLLAGLGHSAILHTFRNLAKLEIEAGAAAAVFCGDPARFTLRLINRRGNARYALKLRTGSALTTIDRIDAEGSSNAELVLPTQWRGWLRLPRVTLETRYPLGLIRAWSYLQPDMSILVWPRPEPDPPPLPLGHGDAGGIAASAAGRDDFAGLRLYQPGDSPRHIAWKAAAGGGPLLTKHFSGMQAGNVVLRWDDLPPQMDNESRLSRLAAWIERANAGGMGWRLELPGASLGPADGSAHRNACLKALALFGQPQEPA
ncbi:MAG: DUF58 domain-containing protein [Candidatus Methylophosphatis roskildensis]